MEYCFDWMWPKAQVLYLHAWIYEIVLVIWFLYLGTEFYTSYLVLLNLMENQNLLVLTLLV